MEFNPNEWLRIYKKVHSVGREINCIQKTINSLLDQESCDRLNNKLSNLKKKFESLLHENNEYLLKCGLISYTNNKKRNNHAL